jgi:hypothetical protein
LLFYSNLLAQKSQSFLNVEKNFFHEEYMLNGQKITERQVLKVMATYPEAVKMLKASRRNEFLGMVLVSIGGGELVASIADGVAENELRIAPTLFSAMIFGGGLVVWTKSIKKARKGIELYNYQYATAQKYATAQNNEGSKFLNFGLTNKGLSVAFHF